MSMASRAILANFSERTVNSKPPTIPFGIVTCTFSDNLLAVFPKGPSTLPSYHLLFPLNHTDASCSYKGSYTQPIFCGFIFNKNARFDFNSCLQTSGHLPVTEIWCHVFQPARILMMYRRFPARRLANRDITEAKCLHRTMAPKRFGGRQTLENTLLIVFVRCHRSGNGQGKNFFNKVRKFHFESWKI